MYVAGEYPQWKKNILLYLQSQIVNGMNIYIPIYIDLLIFLVFQSTNIFILYILYNIR